ASTARTPARRLTLARSAGVTPPGTEAITSGTTRCVLACPARPAPGDPWPAGPLPADTALAGTVAADAVLAGAVLADAVLASPGPATAAARPAAPWPPLSTLTAAPRPTASSTLPATAGTNRRRMLGTLTVTQLYSPGRGPSPGPSRFVPLAVIPGTGGRPKS